MSVIGTSTSASSGRPTAGLPEVAAATQPAPRPRVPPPGPGDPVPGPGCLGGPGERDERGVRSSSVTDSMPNASRTRSSTAASACWPRSTLPAAVTSISDSALALAACLLRRAAPSTTELITRPTATKMPSASALLASAIVH